MIEEKVRFSDFYNAFSEQELPFVIHSELHHEINRRGDFFPKAVTEKYLIQEAQLPYDEYTEFMPVFIMDQTDDYLAVIVWVEGLLTYEYWLLTFDKKGKLIDKSSIAGQKVGEEGILNRLATIENPTSVVIIEAETDHYLNSKGATSAEELNLEINPSGFILTL